MIHAKSEKVVYEGIALRAVEMHFYGWLGNVQKCQEFFHFLGKFKLYIWVIPTGGDFYLKIPAKMIATDKQF